MGVKRTGPWSQTAKRLHTVEKRLAHAIHHASVVNALGLVEAVQQGIVNQAPGGQAFVPLAPSTIARKASSKALIDSGVLINAITHRVKDDKVFVGLLRGARYKEGKELVNVGAIMEYGATIKTKGKVRSIPARPFLAPVLHAERDKVYARYREAIKKVMKGAK